MVYWRIYNNDNGLWSKQAYQQINYIKSTTIRHIQSHYLVYFLIVNTLEKLEHQNYNTAFKISKKYQSTIYPYIFWKFDMQETIFFLKKTEA